MSDLMSTALVMAGIFVVCYPLFVFVLNRIMTKLEDEQNTTKTIN